MRFMGERSATAILGQALGRWSNSAELAGRGSGRVWQRAEIGRRCPVPRRRLVGRRDTKQGRLVERTTDQVEADRKPGGDRTDQPRGGATR